MQSDPFILDSRPWLWNRCIHRHFSLRHTRPSCALDSPQYGALHLPKAPAGVDPCHERAPIGLVRSAATSLFFACETVLAAMAAKAALPDVPNISRRVKGVPPHTLMFSHGKNSLYCCGLAGRLKAESYRRAINASKVPYSTTVTTTPVWLDTVPTVIWSG